jgi:2-(1,2-epoxy-1,2-dihydrophenyl)acetyl-CoA isomerase
MLSTCVAARKSEPTCTPEATAWINDDLASCMVDDPHAPKGRREIVTIRTGDVGVNLAEDGVATVEIQRPPENYFDLALIESLVEAFQALDAERSCRAIVLCSQGPHFCAGADLRRPSLSGDATGSWGAGELYDAAARLIDTKTPVVAAVQGAAIGGGLGLACAADFRVASTLARFSANFARLGFHQGFGLTVTLPMIIGQQHASVLLYTGRRLTGTEALAIGLCDRVVNGDEVRTAAHSLAAEIASAAPLAVRSIRETMRAGLVERFREATARELTEQERLRTTKDFAEGVAAAAERRDPEFDGS